MKIKTLLLVSLLLVLFSLSLVPASAQEKPIVRAILFYSRTCPHCEQVITQDLPPLIEKYPDQLLILGIDIATQQGNELFAAVVEFLGVPVELAGVPFLLVGDRYLVGSLDIPQQFPAIIEQGLTSAGIDWPEIPVLLDFLEAEGFLDAVPQPAPTESQEPELPAETPLPTATPLPTEVPPTDAPVPPTATPGITLIDQPANDSVFGIFAERFARDKTANTIAVIVLVLMIAVLVWVAVKFVQVAQLRSWPEWVLPVLALIGLGVALYLTFSEVSGSEVICGPVGDCNTVQHSPYAKLFGVLHVGLLGVIGYLALGAAWALARFGPDGWRNTARMALFGFAIFGLLFSIYLTFLEPFVIGATCAWCVISALLMTLITLYATPLALQSWAGMEVDLDEEYDDEYDDGKGE